MSNMSYCRFENTALDFEDCAGALEEMLNGEQEVLSLDEQRGFARLLTAVATMLETISIHTGMESEDIMEVIADHPTEIVKRLMKITEDNQDDWDDDL